MSFPSLRFLPAAQCSLILVLLLVAGPSIQAQVLVNTPPNAYSEVTEMPEDEAAVEEESAGMRALQAIFWYLPNRVLDVLDIPQAYMTVGDGMGASVRATKYINASWMYNDVVALGYYPRTPPMFDESIQESYFGFFAAQAGEVKRDWTEVGVSAHFALLGFNLALSLGETVDAITGIVGIDLMGDDHGPMLIEDDEDQTEDAGDEAAAE